MTSYRAQPYPKLTSTTAPGKIFESRMELAAHYKSDWHKYNVKRREASMSTLKFEDFQIRYEAALALRRDREGMAERSGKDHLKDKTGANQKTKKGKSIGEKKLSKRQLRQLQRNGKAPATKEISRSNESHEECDVTMEEQEPESLDEGDVELPTIDPNQSLFDKHISASVEANVEYMYEKYGFFLPDKECIIDLEGLIGYCAEKVKLGHTCLYCQKMFKSWRACQEHMIHTRHTKLRYEAGIDLWEFDPFYDFSKDDTDFLESGIGNYKKKSAKRPEEQCMQCDVIDDEEDEDSGEWEDVEDDDMESQNEDEDMESQNEDGLYSAFQDEIANHGFDITPLGELIFPDGRIVGHRGLSRYYKQRFAPENSRTAVLAAKRANGERLLDGRVYDLNALKSQQDESALQLVKAGLAPGAARGRAGRGILVNVTGSGDNGGASYTMISLYRYKAAVNKARREDFKGRRLQQKTILPMNKMDKKANRLYNNVSVAHAAR